MHHFHSNAERSQSPFADKNTSTHQGLAKKGKRTEELLHVVHKLPLPGSLLGFIPHSFTPSDSSDHLSHLKTISLTLILSHGDDDGGGGRDGSGGGGAVGPVIVALG